LPPGADPPAIELPRERAGWRGEDQLPDRLFVGQFEPGQVLSPRYERETSGRGPQGVDLLVGYQDREDPSSRLPLPDALVRRPARRWLLGQDVRAAVAARDSELVLAYLWRPRDEGIWRETWRAAWALERGPFRRERQRAVVRLTTPLADAGPDARDRARRALDRFVADFRSELSGL